MAAKQLLHPPSPTAVRNVKPQKYRQLETQTESKKAASSTKNFSWLAWVFEVWDAFVAA